MSASTKMFTVDKFLGLNESPDGDTELKMGQASRMENWTITDACNLKVRPGIRRITMSAQTSMTILDTWSGYIGGTEYLLIASRGEDSEEGCVYVYSNEDAADKLTLRYTAGVDFTTANEDVPLARFLAFNGKVRLLTINSVWTFQDGEFVSEKPYIPLVVTGASPSGGGTALESYNLLTAYRRIDFSADGESRAFVLPEEAKGVYSITVDNEELNHSDVGSFGTLTHTFTFKEAPAKGVGNVEFTYWTDSTAETEARKRILNMSLMETFNGSTDTRLFVAGDGTNICCYTGVPSAGDASLLYFPAMNEVAVDMSDSPVTGLVRHYSKLLVFKPDGAYTITYEPVTLETGDVIAGFYLRPASRDFGNEAPGQVQTVNNYPRTFSGGGIYEWRITSTYYRDERYAKKISAMVAESIAAADPAKIVACDDNYGKSYYVFLNDEEGTVLVNRYDLEDGNIWCMYKSKLCRDVKRAMMYAGMMVFMNDTDIFYFDDGLTEDDPEEAGGETQAIRAVWESGFMDFGADFRKKYSSRIYVSMLPENSSWMTVTAVTDRRESYTEKSVGNNILSFSNANFARWSFNMRNCPRINSIRLKVKKFVYYKLIFKVEGKGDRATVLGYDQQVRFASLVK